MSESIKYEVQVGKGRGAYATRYTFIGDIRKACFYYQSINVGRGYKKRLLSDGKTIARQFSC